jgi:hypothetical protein
MRYFLGLLGVVAFIILVIVLIMRSGPKNATTNTPGGAKIVKLADYINKDSEVRLTIDGQVNAEENHRTIQIAVTPNSRSLTVFKGYTQEALKQQTYPNNGAAYDAFLRTLANLNFVKEKPGVRQTDERGVCPTGNRYIYELREGGKEVLRLWSTNCSSSQGTFAGTASAIQSLFQRQIPDYNKLTGDVTL